MLKKRHAPILQCRLPQAPHSHRLSHSSATSRITIWEILLTALFAEFCHQTGPAGLVACADPGAVVSMKIFVKQDEISPVRIALKEFHSSSHRATPILSSQENMSEPPGNLRGYLPQIGFG